MTVIGTQGAAPFDPLRGASPCRVLVADDSADSAEVLALLLGHAGFDVAIAADGQQALSALGELEHQALVIDVELPDIHGLEVARRVRESGFSGKIVAVSGRGDDATQQNARVAGVDHYLVKPCDVHELIRLLRNGMAKD